MTTVFSLLDDQEIMIREMFQKAGWEVRQIGGGCEGFVKIMDDNRYFLATNIDGINVPDNLNDIMLGHYNIDGEQANQPYLMTWAQLGELIESYQQLTDGLAKGHTYESEDDQKDTDTET